MKGYSIVEAIITLLVIAIAIYIGVVLSLDTIQMQKSTEVVYEKLSKLTNAYGLAINTMKTGNASEFSELGFSVESTEVLNGKCVLYKLKPADSNNNKIFKDEYIYFFTYCH